MTTQVAPRFRLSWPVPTYLVLAAAGLVLDAVAPLPWLGSPAADLLVPVGVIIGSGGLAIVVAALRKMRKAGTTVLPGHESAHLVTGGPFALSRNPIYVGFTAIVVAMALILGSLWLIGSAFIAALVVDRLVIRAEERALDARFGKRYRDYMRKVRRWL